MSATPDSQQSIAPELRAEPGYRHGLLSWRIARRWLFVLACLATLIGLVYAVEDWRGKLVTREAFSTGGGAKKQIPINIGTPARGFMPRSGRADDKK